MVFDYWPILALIPQAGASIAEILMLLGFTIIFRYSAYAVFVARYSAMLDATASFLGFYFYLLSWQWIAPILLNEISHFLSHFAAARVVS